MRAASRAGFGALLAVGGLALASELRPDGASGQLAPPAVPTATSFVDARVPDAPQVLPRSREMVRRSILPYVRSANLASSNAWGVPVVRASAGDPVRRIYRQRWGYGTPGAVRFRIPRWAKPSTGSDHHLTVIDGDRQLDMWGAERRPDGSWRAGSRVVHSSTIAGREGATASGFALTTGLLKPEDIADGRIDHALTFTTPHVGNRIVPPAVKGDGRQRDTHAMPMGTHVQLDPATDLSGLPRAERIIAQALKDHGAFLVDTGGSLAIRAESGVGQGPGGRTTDPWTPVGLSDPSLRRIPWHRLRVIAPPARGAR